MYILFKKVIQKNTLNVKMSFINGKDSDNYATDKNRWEMIKDFIPKNKKNMGSVLLRRKIKGIF